MVRCHSMCHECKLIDKRDVSLKVTLSQFHYLTDLWSSLRVPNKPRSSRSCKGSKAANACTARKSGQNIKGKLWQFWATLLKVARCKQIVLLAHRNINYFTTMSSKWRVYHRQVSDCYRPVGNFSEHSRTLLWRKVKQKQEWIRWLCKKEICIDVCRFFKFQLTTNAYKWFFPSVI